MAEDRQFVTFRMDNNFFGIDILTVKEVNIDYAITPVHHAPNIVKGYVNLRGEIFLILNLRSLLGLSEKDIKKSKLIIFKESIAEPFGIIVDSIGDVITVTEDKFQEFETIEENSTLNQFNQTQIIEGICKLDNELLVTIDAKKIFSTLLKQKIKE